MKIGGAAKVVVLVGAEVGVSSHYLSLASHRQRSKKCIPKGEVVVFAAKIGR